jgi:GT2 family glycosyltransferase
MGKMAEHPTVSVAIVNYNGGTTIEPCLESLERAGGYHEIIVVDNASTDGSPDAIERRFPSVRLVRAGGNLGFAGGNNLAASLAAADVLAIFNPDAFATRGWLEPLLAALAAGSAIVSPKIYRGLGEPSTTLDSAGGDLEYPLGEGPPRGYLEADDGRFEQRQDVAYCPGAAFVIAKSTYTALGGLDASFFCYAEESDLCWRARMRGLRCTYEPASIVYHVGSATFGPRSAQKLFYQTRNRIRMCLQNYAPRNAARFVAYEAVHGLCVMLATMFFPAYRDLGSAYARAWFATLVSLPSILRKRALRQHERTLGDAEVLRLHRRVGLIATIRRYRTFSGGRSGSLFNSAANVSHS